MAKETVLVIAAHPDDEILGCGGTMAWHVDRGDTVHVLIMAEGLTSRLEARDRTQVKGELSELAQAAQKANDIIGVSSLELLDFPDNRMDNPDRLNVIKAVEKKVDAICPTVIYTHHAGDVNIDHRRIHEAVVTACRPQPGNRIKDLLFFEVASSTEWQPPQSAPAFSPNWFVDISATLNRKLDALGAYSSEMRDWPHSRSIPALEHLARWRGATVGCEAAEAFMLGRRVV